MKATNRRGSSPSEEIPPFAARPATFEMSVAEVWDFISGTSDRDPTDARLLSAIEKQTRSRLGKRRLRILDLGAGAGNPSIALAASHDVTLVDADPVLVASARRRAGLAEASLEIVHADWRTFLESGSEGGPFDLILFLGNALAYQDSWPDRDLPPRCTLDCLSQTVTSCSRLLSPSGMILLESPVEPRAGTSAHYVREIVPPRASTVADRSIWIVDYDEETGRRVIDTLVLRTAEATEAVIVGRVRFVGRLFTSATMEALAGAAGLRCDRIPAWPRAFLDAFLFVPR